MSRRYSGSKSLALRARKPRLNSCLGHSLRRLRMEPLEDRSLLAALDYSAFLGGTLLDQGHAVAVDSAGNAYVAGQTTSAGFPATVGAIDTTYNGGVDGIVAKFDSSGALVWATYLGGGGDDRAVGIVLDSTGNVYATGTTLSSNFPVTPGAFDTSPNGGEDTWVAKLNPSGSTLIYSTYLGGSDHDHSSGGGQGFAVDAAGNAYVTGDTRSGNYPTTPGAFQTTYRGGLDDGVVTVLSPAGNALVYSTFLGGSGSDRVNGIALDSSGNACLIGITNSGNFPTVNPLQGSFAGGEFDAFVAKLNPAGSTLLYSTYHGGSDADFGSDIAVNSSDEMYLLGGTRGTLPTTIGAFQTTKPGSEDNYVFKLNPSGSARVFATYLGGSGIELASALDIDASGNVMVVGATTSTNYPTANALQPAYGGGARDAVVTQLNASGTALLYSSYLGGSALDHIYDLALDGAGQPIVVGYSESSNFPTTPGAYDNSHNGGDDAFVTKICINAVNLDFALRIGNTGQDGNYAAIAADGSGNVYA